MIRFLLRFLGLWLLAAGFIVLMYDGTKTIAGNAVYISKLQDTWATVHQSSLQALRPAVEHYGVPYLWDPIVLNVLLAPTWAVFGVLGIILVLLGRKKRPLIGYGRD